MLLHSRRKFQIRAVTVGTARLTFFMSNGEFWTLDAVVLGANRYYQAGKHGQLGWPPETVFAEYGPAFTKNPGALGYAKPLLLKGHLTSTYLINSKADRQFVLRKRQKMIGAIVKLFQRWLESDNHPSLRDWPKHLRALRAALNAFSSHKLTFADLMAQFKAHFAPVSAHQNRRTQGIFEQAEVFAQNYVKALNARLPIAILFINVQDVEYFNYSDDRDLLFNTDIEDAALRKAGDLQRVMFTRVNQQKAQFQRDGIPFYQPQWLATQRARDQPIWDPAQLSNFHLKE